MEKIITLIEYLLGSYPFLISVNILSFSLKACLLYLFVSNSSRSYNRLHLYLFLILLGAMAEDFAWSLLLFKECFFPDATEFTFSCILFIARLAWTLYAIECQSIALLLESLSSQSSKINLRQKVMIFITGIFCLLFIGAAIHNISYLKPTFFLLLIEWLFSFYAIFILLPSSVFFSIIQMRKNRLPRSSSYYLALLLSSYNITPSLYSKITLLIVMRW